MRALSTNEHSITTIEFLIPTRGLMGYRNEFMTATKGLGILTSIFDHFEVETPAWRKMLRWGIAAGGTIGLYGWIGHYALLFPAGFAILGAAVHLSWCRRNGIHPIRATPRRCYYELRGWDWTE